MCATVQGIAHMAKHTIGPRTVQQLSVGKAKNTRPSAHQSSTHFRTNQFPVVLLALGCVLATSGEQFLPLRDRKVVVEAIFRVLDMLFELRRECFHDEVLDKLENEVIPKALQSVHNVYKRRQFYLCSNVAFEGIKLHLLLHFPQWIRRFGAPSTWDTATWESAHKSMVKFHYKHGSKRVSNIDEAVLQSVRVISLYAPKPPI